MTTSISCKRAVRSTANEGQTGGRGIEEPDGEVVGVVVGSQLVCNSVISSQPVSAFDWHSGKAGVFLAAAYDQTVRVRMASRVNAR
ncbi:hypothetical protein D9Q98_004921 [Chlorella vulgaris]|uniref:Uncharacterized protein n=1 Tax=Chlorella vulgaris TaxID=3077 RepID=A0A9D4TNH1_CHLVU|nr:hypothetical protein D9Q98_004921 [Chlorella vulgaris]